MTSSTPPPVAAPYTDDDSAVEAPPGPRVRRFGGARAFALGLAALVGGYLASFALAELHMVISDRAWGAYNVFDGDTEKNRRALALAWCLLALLTGLVALLGLALRRWAVGVLVLTLLSVLCHAAFVLITLDSAWRSAFLDSDAWTPARGLPFSIVVGGLQLLVMVLCLVRGPVVNAPEPVAISTTPPPVPMAGPGTTAGVDADHDDDRMAGPDDLAETPAPVAAPVVIDESDHDHESDIHDALVDDDTDDVPDEVYLVIHGQEYGPYPPERVRGFMVEGRIHPGTIVRIGDETKPAAQVPSIFG